jgi:hypothetical protein
MIKNIEEKPRTIELNLTGPDGNVFNLIGVGRRLCKQLGIDKGEFTREMISGDYENAVTTFENYFGEFVILYR